MASCVRLNASHRGREARLGDREHDLTAQALGTGTELPERLWTDQGLRAGLRFILSSHLLPGLGVVKCHHELLQLSKVNSESSWNRSLGE